jgi:hypothetical protein
MLNIVMAKKAESKDFLVRKFFMSLKDFEIKKYISANNFSTVWFEFLPLSEKSGGFYNGLSQVKRRSKDFCK